MILHAWHRKYFVARADAAVSITVLLLSKLDILLQTQTMNTASPNVNKVVKRWIGKDYMRSRDVMGREAFDYWLMLVYSEIISNVVQSWPTMLA